MPKREKRAEVAATAFVVHVEPKARGERSPRDAEERLAEAVGLAAAIEWQLNEFKQRTHLDYESNLNIDESALNIDSRTALFRIFQR